MKNQQGVALVLVLMVVGVVGLLVLYSGVTARQDVNLARQLQERTEATLMVQSRMAAVSYTMLTEPWVVGEGYTGENPYRAAWNFRNEAFDVDGVVIRIQDINGLLSVPPRGQESVIFEPLLERLGVPTDRARRATRMLAEIQADTPLQAFDELRREAALTSEEIDALKRVATLYPVTIFNPITASPEVLRLRYSGSALSSILELRARGEMTMQQLTNVAGEEISDVVVPVAGPAFRVQIEARRGGSVVRREATMSFNPTGDIPMSQWDAHRMAAEDAVLQ